MSQTAWNLIGIVPWIVLAVIVAPAVVTGRELLLGLPTGWPAGWQLRTFAAISIAASGYMVYQTLTTGVYRDGLFFSYVAIAAYTVWAVYELRKRRRSAAR